MRDVLKLAQGNRAQRPFMAIHVRHNHELEESAKNVHT